MERIRAFVAIGLAPGLVEEIAKFLDTLREQTTGNAVRWVREDQLHVTLWFMGHIQAENLTEMTSRLRDVCASLPGFTLTLDRLGCFPTFKNPKIIWIGMRGANPALLNLQQRIQSALAPFTEQQEDRAFHPHLTIGRSKVHGKPARLMGELIQKEPLPPLSDWEVREALLMRSHLSTHGSRYECLARLPLAEPRHSKEA